jgi:ATP synthase, F0 subunit b
MGQNLEFVSIVPWNIIFQWGNLLILFLLVKKFLFKPVMSILEKRQQEVDKLYSDAQRAQEEAQALRDDYQQHMAKAKEEAGEILRTASQQAQRRSDELVNDAQQKAASILARADAEITQEKKKAISEIKGEISGMAVEIASKVVEREISAKDHEKLIEEFIKNVGEAS